VKIRAMPRTDEDDEPLLARFRALAATLDLPGHGLDEAAYASARVDPLQPLVGLGPRDAPLCFFGRDPGMEELRLRQPFVGEAGRLLRRGLLAHAGAEAADAALPELLRAGERFFWLNIVPYKPRGNDVWNARVRHAFRPLVLACLLERWDGAHVVTLGEHAFRWFAHGQPREVKEAFDARWARVLAPGPGVTVRLAADGRERLLQVHPLPHPSPRNVKGRAAFPALLQACLRGLSR
jgi:uracil-DNA glycosylase